MLGKEEEEDEGKEEEENEEGANEAVNVGVTTLVVEEVVEEVVVEEACEEEEEDEEGVEKSGSHSQDAPALLLGVTEGCKNSDKLLSSAISRSWSGGGRKSKEGVGALEGVGVAG